MATKTSICNMALTHISAKNQIANADTDTSIEAKTCRVFYEDALKFVLSDLDWGFATGRKLLAELSETAPADWDYVYAYPNDCVKAREIYTGNRRTGTEDIAFEIGLNADNTVKAIYSDQYQATLRYTANVTNPNLFPAGFVTMFAWYLASLIAMPLTKKKAIKDDAEKGYKEAKAMAAAIDASEDDLFEDTPDSEFIRTRE